MRANSAIGPMRKAENGLAATSTLCAEAEDPARVRNGTTRCRIVCSADSAAGMIAMKTKMPRT